MSQTENNQAEQTAPVNSPFHVLLNIRAGEYEKTSNILVSAPDAEQAADYAIYLEAHEPERLEWDENGAADLGWEFYYSAGRTDALTADEAEIMSRFFSIHEYDLATLKKSGNWVIINGTGGEPLTVTELLELNTVQDALKYQEEGDLRSILDEHLVSPTPDQVEAVNAAIKSHGWEDCAYKWYADHGWTYSDGTEQMLTFLVRPEVTAALENCAPATLLELLNDLVDKPQAVDLDMINGALSNYQGWQRHKLHWNQQDGWRYGLK
jgi:hypothetical protein